jgi:acetyl esterase/lipase
MQSFTISDHKPAGSANRFLPFSSGETRTEYHLHHQGYNFGITLLGRPFLRKKPPFLFLSPCGGQKQNYQQSFAAHISRFCLRSGVIIHSGCSDSMQATIFEAFAAVKWLCRHSKLLGIDTREMPLVGTGFGASTAAVISMMATSETGLNLGGKVLVDASFRLPEGLFLQGSSNGNVKSKGKSAGDWINMQDVYNLPFRAGAAELRNQPPTLFQFTQNALWDEDGKRYYGRLMEAGAAVNCVCYESANRFSTTQEPFTRRDLLQDLASALG